MTNQEFFFASRVRTTLQVSGVVNLSQSAGHSFHTRAATTAAIAGIMFKTLSWWKNSAFLHVGIPQERLAGLSKVLSAF